MNIGTAKKNLVRKSSNQTYYKPKPSKMWKKNDEGIEIFYTYILKLNDGNYYVGQTRELRERMIEHKNGKVSSTAGKQPHLQYFEKLTSRDAAMIRESEIKKLTRRNNREILRMITQFSDLTRELDFN